MNSDPVAHARHRFDDGSELRAEPLNELPLRADESGDLHSWREVEQ